MNYFQHSFEDVEGYLHHRPPYLMVDQIVSIGEAEILTRKRVAEVDGFLQGHFPGAPIFPGAMLQEVSTQSAGILIAARYNPMSVYDTNDPNFNEYALGVLVRVSHARYRGFARPGDELQLRVTLQEHLSELFEFSAVATVEGKTIMQNRFQLMNIPSSQLRGADVKD